MRGDKIGGGGAHMSAVQCSTKAEKLSFQSCSLVNYIYLLRSILPNMKVVGK